MPENEITAVLKLRDELTGAFRRVGKFLTGESGVIGRSFSRISRKVLNLRNLLIGVGTIAFGKKLAGTAMEFETSLSQIVGLVGESQEQVDAWAESIVALGPALGKSPRELAKGLFFLTSAGLEGQAALDALVVSAKAASAGLGETESVANAVTSAVASYGAANLTAAEAGDILVATVREGKAAASALAPQFGRLLGPASELGISFDQVGGALAFLTRRSGDAALAATQLSGVLQRMLKPTAQGIEALDAAGISVVGLRESIKEKGLLETLSAMRKQLEENGQELSSVIEDSRGLNAALLLTGGGLEEAREVMDSLANSTGALDAAFKTAAETSGFKFQQVMAAIESVSIQVGKALNEVLAAGGLFDFLILVVAELKTQFEAWGKGMAKNGQQAANLADTVIRGVRAIAEGFAVLWDVVRLGTAIFKIIRAEWSIAFEFLKAGVGTLQFAFEKAWQAVQNSAVKMFNFILRTSTTEFLPNMLRGISEVIIKLSGLLAHVADGLKQMPGIPESVIAGTQLLSDKLAQAGAGLRNFSRNVKELEEDKRDVRIEDFVDPGAVGRARNEFAKIQSEIDQFLNTPTTRQNFVKFFDEIEEKLRLVRAGALDVGDAFGGELVAGIDAATGAAARMGESMDETAEKGKANIEATQDAIDAAAERARLVAGIIHGFASTVADFVGRVLDKAFEGQIRTMKDVAKIAQEVLKDITKQVVRALVQIAVQAIVTRVAAGIVGGGGTTAVATVGAAEGAVFPGGLGPVPGLAEGAIVTRPILAAVGEGGGPEAVIPLSRNREVPVELRQGDKAGQRVVTINFNVSAVDPQDVARFMNRPETREAIRANVVNGMRDEPDFRSAVDGEV